MENVNQPKKKMSLMRKILIGVGILFVIGIIANLGKNGKENSSVKNSATGSEKTMMNRPIPKLAKQFKLVILYIELMKSTSKKFLEMNSPNKKLMEFIC